jgi:hypothetical protein
MSAAYAAREEDLGVGARTATCHDIDGSVSAWAPAREPPF